MNRAAYALGRIIEPCGLDAAGVERQLTAACLEAGFNPDKVADCIPRSMAAGRVWPRTVAEGAPSPDLPAVIG
jgi:hypothetical protein